MASLIIQDVFEPYYAGRDDLTADRAAWRPKRAERRPAIKSGEVALPEEGSARMDAGVQRLPLAH